MRLPSKARSRIRSATVNERAGSVRGRPLTVMESMEPECRGRTRSLARGARPGWWMLTAPSAHGPAQEPKLRRESRALVAPGEMHAQTPTLPPSQSALLGLRKQTRDVLAHEQVAERTTDHRERPLPENQLCSRHSRSAMRARYRITQRLFAVIASSVQISSLSSS